MQRHPLSTSRATCCSPRSQALAAQSRAGSSEQLDKTDREDAYQGLVKLVAEYGWLAGRDAEPVVPTVRSACYKEGLRAAADD